MLIARSASTSGCTPGARLLGWSAHDATRALLPALWRATGVARRSRPGSAHLPRLRLHPLPQPRSGGGVLLPEPGGVLLVRRKYEPAAGAWCVPAGFIEYGESPKRCAVREVAEETGLRVRLTGLFGVYAGFDDPRVRAVLILYTAERLGGRLRPGMTTPSRPPSGVSTGFPAGSPSRRIAGRWRIYAAAREARRRRDAADRGCRGSSQARSRPVSRGRDPGRRTRPRRACC